MAFASQTRHASEVEYGEWDEERGTRPHPLASRLAKHSKSSNADLWANSENGATSADAQQADFGAYSATGFEDLDDLIDPITLRNGPITESQQQPFAPRATDQPISGPRTAGNGNGARSDHRPPVNGHGQVNGHGPMTGLAGGTIYRPPAMPPSPPLFSAAPPSAPPFSPIPISGYPGGTSVSGPPISGGPGYGPPRGPASGPPVSPGPTSGGPPRSVRPVPPLPLVPPLDAEEPEEEPESDGTYRGAAVAALLWCTVPMALFIGWALFIARGPETGCVDNTGQPCARPSVVAWSSLPYVVPVVAIATLLSVVIALMLRRVTTGWKSSTVGFASAVVAAGVVTVFWSALDHT